ncbi:hypothetical protein V2J09_010348, partial [Rumex salicifolius]
GKEFDLDKLHNITKEYAEAKALASELVDVQDIKHLAENVPSIGDEVKKIVEDWNRQENVFHEQQPNPKRKSKPLPENEDHGQIVPVQ